MTPRLPSGGHVTAWLGVPHTVPHTSDDARLRIHAALLVATAVARTAAVILDNAHRRAAQR